MTYRVVGPVVTTDRGVAPERNASARAAAAAAEEAAVARGAGAAEVPLTRRAARLADSVRRGAVADSDLLGVEHLDLERRRDVRALCALEVGDGGGEWLRNFCGRLRSSCGVA